MSITESLCYTTEIGKCYESSILKKKKRILGLVQSPKAK